VPGFSRALCARGSAECRARRSADELRRGARHPFQLGVRHVRAAAHYISRRAALPWLRRKVDRLAAIRMPQPTVMPMALLTPQAAAIPSEQPAFEAADGARRDVVLK